MMRLKLLANPFVNALLSNCVAALVALRYQCSTTKYKFASKAHGTQHLSVLKAQHTLALLLSMCLALAMCECLAYYTFDEE